MTDGPEMFKFRRLWQKPELHQDWGDLQSERKVTWSELFTDVMYVVGSIVLSKLIIEDPSAQGVALFLLYFSLFWNIWNATTMFHTRIKLSGLVFELMYLTQNLGLLGMVLHCGDFDRYAQFAGCYCIAKGVLAVQYFVSAVFIKRARWNCSLNALLAFTTVALGVITIFFDSHVFVALMVLNVAMDGCQPLLPVVMAKARLPVHIEHTSERFGLIMMIFLGESIVALGLQNLTFDVLQYLGIAFGCVTIWCLHLVYYHINPTQHHHALRIHRYRGFVWSYSHWVLGALFLMMGAGLRLLLSTYHQLGSSTAPARLLMDSTAATAAVSLSGSYAAAEDLTVFAQPLQPAGTSLLGMLAGMLGVKGSDLGRGLLQVQDSYVDINDGYEKEGAWIMCFAYSASIHTMGIIRASHYMHFRGNDVPIYQAAKKARLTPVLWIWWAIIFGWPFVTYFIPFALSSMTPTGILGMVAAHCVLLNVMETSITHSIAGHAAWRVVFYAGEVDLNAIYGNITKAVASTARASWQTSGPFADSRRAAYPTKPGWWEQPQTPIGQQGTFKLAPAPNPDILNTPTYGPRLNSLNSLKVGKVVPEDMAELDARRASYNPRPNPVANPPPVFPPTATNTRLIQQLSMQPRPSHLPPLNPSDYDHHSDIPDLATISVHPSSVDSPLRPENGLSVKAWDSAQDLNIPSGQPDPLPGELRTSLDLHGNMVQPMTARNSQEEAMPLSRLELTVQPSQLMQHPPTLQPAPSLQARPSQRTLSGQVSPGAQQADIAGNSQLAGIPEASSVGAEALPVNLIVRLPSYVDRDDGAGKGTIMLGV